MSRHSKILTRSFAGGEMSPEMFGRMDDVKFQAGAATLLNVIPRPSGPVFRRPGTKLVRAIRDSSKEVRLFPFKFSASESLVIEASRADVGTPSRETGYFRFHKDGGSLLYSEQPALHLGPWYVTVNASTDIWEAATPPTGHTQIDLATGDAVVITVDPSEATSRKVTFISQSSTAAQAFTVNDNTWTGMQIDTPWNQQAIFSGSNLPSNIEANRAYYITHRVDKLFYLSETFAGPKVRGSGKPGTGAMACLPVPKYGDTAKRGISINRVYYAVDQGPDTKAFKLADTYAKAISTSLGAKDSIDITAAGVGEINVHRAYVPGDLVSKAPTTAGYRNFYCIRSPWSSAADPFDSKYNYKTDHDETDYGHLPGTHGADTGRYWMELTGKGTGAQFRVHVSVGSPMVVTAANHGLQNGQAISTRPDYTADVNGLVVGNIYYVVNRTDTTFNLASTPSGSPMASGGPASKDIFMQAWVTTDISTDRIGFPGHGFVDGDTVIFSSTALTPEPLVAGTVYYVRNKTTDDFQVSATPGGALIDITSVGTPLGKPQVSVLGNSIYDVPHNYSEDELARLSTTQSNDVFTLASSDHPVAELRRISASRWEMHDVKFRAAASVPDKPYEIDIDRGESHLIYALDKHRPEGDGWQRKTDAARMWSVHDNMPFAVNDPVHISGMAKSNEKARNYEATGIADGFYMIAQVAAEGHGTWRFWIKDTKTGTIITTTATGGDSTPTGVSGYIRHGVMGTDLTQKYSVTSIDRNGEESIASEVLEVENNLLVAGSFNKFGWGAATGATRYRVYKYLNGLYGLVGETEELFFKDDNIGPDLGVAPPIEDPALRVTARVEISVLNDAVTWSAHGLFNGSPVVFFTNKRMGNIVEGNTYYAINVTPDTFQITNSPGSSTVLDFTGTVDGEHYAVAGSFPSTVSYFEGRRVFGGSRTAPQDVWMTASGTESDLSYSIPTVDSDRIYFRIASRQQSAVRHLIPMSQLLMLSDTTEYRLTPANDDILTPMSVSVRPQSFIGSGTATPALVNNTVVFAAARGGHVRELGYNQEVGGYLTGDLSLRAAHLFDGYTIKDQAYAKAPLPIVWCVSSGGKLLGLTYVPEEQVGAWHQHTTPNGSFEAVASIPEGDEDAVYVVVKRTIDSVTTRFVERFANEFRGDTSSLPDAYFLDHGLSYSGAATTTMAGLGHLASQSVSYLADGVVGTGTVSAAGVLTLTKAASKIHVGLTYTSQIQTLPLTMMRVDAFGTGKPKSVNKVWARVFQSGAFKTGPTAANLRSSLTPASGSLLTDLVQVTLPASWDDDGQIVIQQEDPLPLTVTGLTIEVASGG